MGKFAIVSMVLLLAGCSNTGGSSGPVFNKASLGGSTPLPTATPDYPSLPFNDQLCASLGGRINEDSGCQDPTAGLGGSIYVLQDGPPNGNEIQISYILQHGDKLPQKIQMTDFNVGARSFTEGFPLFDGTLLSGPNGHPVTEWFAFDLTGSITLKAPYQSGQYQFAFFVDDGAILTIDNKVVLNFDGFHSPQWACTTTPYTLNVDEQHSLAFQYFQGPKTEIAMRLLIRPYDASKPCNDAGGFSPIPREFFSH